MKIKTINFLISLLTIKTFFISAGLGAFGFIIVWLELIHDKDICLYIGYFLMIPFYLLLSISMYLIAYSLIENFYFDTIIGKTKCIEIKFICNEKQHFESAIQHLCSAYFLFNRLVKYKFGNGLSSIQINLTSDIIGDEFSFNKETSSLTLNFSLIKIIENDLSECDTLLLLGDQIISLLPIIFAEIKIKDFNSELFIICLKSTFLELRDARLSLNKIYDLKFSKS